jgi:hypothetical protein
MRLEAMKEERGGSDEQEAKRRILCSAPIYIRSVGQQQSRRRWRSYSASAKTLGKIRSIRSERADVRSVLRIHSVQ